KVSICLAIPGFTICNPFNPDECVTVDIEVPPDCGTTQVSVTLEEDFVGGAQIDAHLDVPGNFTVPLANIPIPDLSVAVTIPFLDPKIFSATAGVTLKADVSINTVKPFGFQLGFGLAEGYSVGFDTNSGGFANQTTTPSATGNATIDPLGQGDLKLSLGPALGFT